MKANLASTSFSKKMGQRRVLLELTLKINGTPFPSTTFKKKNRCIDGDGPHFVFLHQYYTLMFFL